MIEKATIRQFLSCLLCLFVSFIYGCKMGWIYATISLFLSKNASPFEISKDDISWISSISFTSSFFSVLLCYSASARFGRRQFLICIAIFYIVVWSLILFTSSMMVILICFWLYGIASGTQYIIGYAYIGEVSNPRNRELLGASYSMVSAIGIEMEYLMSYFGSYRVLALFPFIVSIIALLVSFLMVESPYYLVDRGDDEQALSNLCYLANKNEKSEAYPDLQMAREYVNEQKDNRLRNNLQLILMPSNLKLALIMIIINALSTVHAANLISLTGSYMLKDFSASVHGDVFVNIFNILCIVLTLCSCFTIQKFNRRTLFLVGYPMAGLLQLICGLCYYVESVNGNAVYWLANVILYLLVLLLIQRVLTLSIALEILKIEIFPHKLKAFYSSLLLLTSDWAAFALVKSYFYAEPIIGNAFVMVIYALISFTISIIIYFFMPDTKNKTLLQIRVDLNAKSTV